MSEECINCEVKLTDENCTQGAMFCDVCESKIGQEDEKILVIEKWTKETDGTITHKTIT